MSQAASLAAYGAATFAEHAFAGSDPATYVAPTGSSATFSIGSLVITAGGAVIPTGSAATFSTGTETPTGDANFSVTGSSATFSTGSITIDIGVTGFVTGSAATFSIGSVNIEIVVIPTGSAATFSAGTVIPYPGSETHDTSFGETGWAEMSFAGSDQTT